MHSLRTRITLVTIILIVIAVTVVASLSVLFIRNDKRLESDQLLFLLCETGERNLDYYFDSVQKSVEKMSDYIEKDLNRIEELDSRQLAGHIRRAESYFEKMAYKTNGVLTYYYRIDPSVSDTEKGFWYINMSGDDFIAHEVTDITLYDTQDTSRLVWFTVPKHTGSPIWLPPYITDNLGKRVISYNVPIYWKDTFIGVAGIEIDYSTMAEQVESIQLYSNGYAFLCDAEGNLFYHPRIDVSQLTEDTTPKVPDGLIDESTFVRYTFEGVSKQAAWLPLSNGMRLVVSVPTSEYDGHWEKLLQEVVIASFLVLLALSIFTMFYTRKITRPLEELTKAADQVNQDNYDFDLRYDKDDEIGRLTSTFKRLTDHMKDHIDELNKRVYVDALTSVKNKGAFSDAVQKLQGQVNEKKDEAAFAIGVFDCDNLKRINDRFGHDKGDVYLKTACRLICRVFQHSPVFRIGGDEFSVILQRADFENRDELIRQFEASKNEINASAPNEWEEVHVAMGIAVYDPEKDFSVIDVVRHADTIMYANKQKQKQKEAEA